jgi:hypothetical protein
MSYDTAMALCDSAVQWIAIATAIHFALTVVAAVTRPLPQPAPQPAPEPELEPEPQQPQQAIAPISLAYEPSFPAVAVIPVGMTAATVSVPKAQAIAAAWGSTVKELRQQCRDQGIRVPKGTRKAGLVALLVQGA